MKANSNFVKFYVKKRESFLLEAWSGQLMLKSFTFLRAEENASSKAALAQFACFLREMYWERESFCIRGLKQATNVEKLYLSRGKQAKSIRRFCINKINESKFKLLENLPENKRERESFLLEARSGQLMLKSFALLRVKKCIIKSSFDAICLLSSWNILRKGKLLY